MKKLLFVSFALCSTAFATQTINQQYVTATPNQSQSLQQPFAGKQASQNGNYNSQYQSPYQQERPQQAQQQNQQQAQPRPNPDAIYTSPAQTNHILQQQRANEEALEHQQQSSPYHSYGPTQNAQPSSPRNMPSAQESSNPGWNNRPEYPQQQQPTPSYAPQQPNYSPQQHTPEETPVRASQEQTQSPQQPMRSEQPSSAQTQTKQSTSDKAANVWMQNCIKSASGKSAMASYAKPFCECGWDKMLKAGLTPNMLTSKSPQMIEKANMMFSAISQECLAQVLKK